MPLHTGRRQRRFPLALIPPLFPMEAELLFTPDDDFHDHPQTWDLPDCAVALWSRAGSWSARNQQDGFVPAPMLARFCSDPVQAAEELCKRGRWRRVKGGYQFCNWEQYGPTREQLEKERAAAEAQLAGKSGGGKLGNHRRWHAGRGVIQPGCEFCRTPEAAGIPVENTGAKRASDIRSVSDSDPTPRSRSDFDLDQSSVAGHHADRNAGAREEPPALVAAVAKAAAEKAGRIVSDDEARAAIAEIRKRAARARKAIVNAEKYIPSAVRNEPDVFQLILPVGLWEELGAAPAGPAPGIHPYDPDSRTGVCRCGWPQSYAPMHGEARTA